METALNLGARYKERALFTVVRWLANSASDPKERRAGRPQRRQRGMRRASFSRSKRVSAPFIEPPFGGGEEGALAGGKFRRPHLSTCLPPSGMSRADRKTRPAARSSLKGGLSPALRPNYLPGQSPADHYDTRGWAPLRLPLCYDSATPLWRDASSACTQGVTSSANAVRENPGILKARDSEQHTQACWLLGNFSFFVVPGSGFQDSTPARLRVLFFRENPVRRVALWEEPYETLLWVGRGTGAFEA